jgi:hypothetical protein
MNARAVRAPVQLATVAALPPAVRGSVMAALTTVRMAAAMSLAAVPFGTATATRWPAI